MSWWPGDARKEVTSFGLLNRSALMSKVRSTGNLTTEVRMARLLRAAHLSGWRRHCNLPGKPDFCWRKEHVAVFVDGCFWHGHNCGKNIRPARNRRLWAAKLQNNRNRDLRTSRRLRREGWTVLRFWECFLSKRPAACVARIYTALGIKNDRK